ncbi:hypothetical protein [Tenggerimyces flavus]|uniref:Uncharacterized protein n=1 Tax=Tenggerimyces flavus TaxID=1708749 RepID=A0ABV7Y8Z2_9ACTN|nr:hypothetical protein [Tenggerimyces flavus]MBM7791000.1 hypothetical protein [Tenggerimyces flavus]
MTEKRNTRRGMLTGGAVLLGAAVVGSPGTAEAANGNALLIGRANTGSAETKLTNSGTAPGLNVTSTAAAHAALLTTKNKDRWGTWAANDAAGQGVGGAVRADGRQNTGLSAGTVNPKATAITARNTAGGASSMRRAVVGTATPTAQPKLDAFHDRNFWGGGGEFAGTNGLIGLATDFGGYGVLGIATEASGVGVYAEAPPDQTALLTLGNAFVQGNLSKSAGSFKIDHPLDPANKYLSHSFVESPDMMNVYNGNVTADANGETTIELPEWFEALNRDFRYQLTPIGDAAPDLHVKTKVAGGTFSIAGAKPGQEVSWLLTGIRRDAYAEAHRIKVEEAKPAEEKGTYLFPQGFGKPASAGIRRQRPR